jgi:Ca-activated chloride channel homolog
MGRGRHELFLPVRLRPSLRRSIGEKANPLAGQRSFYECDHAKPSAAEHDRIESGHAPVCITFFLSPKRTSFLLSLLLISLLILSVPVSSNCQSQTMGKRDDYKLTVSVDLVGILVTVTTEEGALVSTLQKEDFQLSENGKPQQIALFGRESEQPLRLCLLFDSSSSVVTELKTQQEASIEFLQTLLRPVDRVSIFQVSDEVNELVRLSSRLEKLTSAIRSIRPKGGTSLYDAIFLASESLSRTQGRKVIVVVSDGTDTTSQVQIKDCLKMAQTAEAVLYALVVQPIKSEPGRNLGGEHAMFYLSEKTGGKFFKVTSPELLLASYAGISDELRTQYYLGYYPTERGEKGEFRQIKIQVSNPHYRVRAREGYYTP